ncbi:MAG: hypothetical protein GY705_05980 [Bacteroidetes bacterium]|nr:hypothetical protein [Bacteroidota bacterium]
MYGKKNGPNSSIKLENLVVHCENLHHRKNEFATKLEFAFALVDNFTSKYGWQTLAIEPFVDQLRVFESQLSLWKEIKDITKTKESKPSTTGLSSALISKTLLVITPEEYERIRPEYATIDNAWARLLAHEIFHQLHIRIVVKEELMGPKWFYEGFAMYAAGQHIIAEKPSSIKEVFEAMNAKKRGAYAKYEALFNLLVENIELNETIKRASQKDFHKWLIKSIFIKT